MVLVTQCRILLPVSVLVLVIIVLFTCDGNSNTMTYFNAGICAGFSK